MMKMRWIESYLMNKNIGDGDFEGIIFKKL